MDQGQENSDRKFHVDLVILPTELLVYIISFLSSLRDRVKLRYVSRWLRCVTEGTPSLWKKFIWRYYGSREECCLKEVLKVCGQNIEVFCFLTRSVPGPSTLVEMVQYCGNVQHFSLPETELDLEVLRNVVQHMRCLQSLEIKVDKKDIKQLFLNAVKLRILTIHSSQLKEVFKQWLELKLKPPRLNFITPVDLIMIKNFVDYATQLATIHFTGITANVSVYNEFICKSPHIFSSELPIYQLFFERTGRVTIPCVKLSDIGVQGFNNDRVRNEKIDTHGFLP